MLYILQKIQIAFDRLFPYEVLKKKEDLLYLYHTAKFLTIY